MLFVIVNSWKFMNTKLHIFLKTIISPYFLEFISFSTFIIMNHSIHFSHSCFECGQIGWCLKSKVWFLKSKGWGMKAEGWGLSGERGGRKRTRKRERPRMERMARMGASDGLIKLKIDNWQVIVERLFNPWIPYHYPHLMLIC